MKKRSYVRMSTLAGAVVIGMSGLSCAQAAELLASSHPVAGQYIVVLKKEKATLAGEPAIKGIKRPQVSAIAQEMVAAHSAKLLRSYSRALRGFVVQADDKALARLMADDRVAYIQENGIVTLADTQNNAIWSLDRIDQRDLPLSSTYTYDTNGAGVHAYVIDTGVRSQHTEFTGRIGNGFDAMGDGKGTEDCQGHGTHTAGTVLGTNWGVAKGATLHPVRVFGCQGQTTDDKVLAGIDWVTRNAQLPAVVNMSIGAPKNQAENDAVQGLIDIGVVVVVAAGNSNADACNYSPASAPNAITVGATMSTDRRPDPTNWGTGNGSNYGQCLDLFAPGDQITSASYSSDAGSAKMSGTSMASPAVAGAAALYLAVHPAATPAEVAKALIDNATTGKVTNLGAGSPNRLVYTLGGGANPPPPANAAPVANFTSSASGLTATFNDTSTDSDGTIASRSWAFGDGGTSTQANPSHTYAAAGTYTVKLTVTDDGGATNTKTGSVTVTAPAGNQAPVANFSSSVNGLSATFTDTSTDSDGSIASRSWSFGDGSSSTLANPSHTYAAAGTYTVNLTVTDNNGATNSKSGSVTVTAPPPSSAQTYSNGTDVALVWAGPVTSSISVSGRNGNAPTNAQVSFSLVHPNALVQVDLVAPDGSVYPVKSLVDSFGTVNLSKTVTLNLSAEALNGTWKLRVTDYYYGAASLHGWSIKF